MTLAARELNRIRSTAQWRASRLRGDVVEAGDLENEAVVAALKGRKSVDGPMQDFQRKQAWIGVHRKHHVVFKRIRLVEFFQPYKMPRPERANPDWDHLIARLSENEQEVIYLRYYQGLRQVDVARRLGLSERWTCCVEARAIEHLRHMIAGPKETA